MNKISRKDSGLGGPPKGHPSQTNLVDEDENEIKETPPTTDTDSAIHSSSSFDESTKEELVEVEVKWYVRWYQKIFPPRGSWAKWFTWGFFLLLIYGTMWSLAPNLVVPGNSIFGLIVTFLLCITAEALIIQIPMPNGFPPLPQLLASLLMGVLLKNLPSPLNPADYIYPHWSWSLRTLALAVILTRAGLELDPEAMIKVKWAVVRLAFTPCLFETLTIGLTGHYIMGFPFLWSFMMGFMLAAVSPAVVIPCLIILQEEGYGVEKGIPSLVMAASGIDDVLAIAGFTVLLGIAMPYKLEDEIIHGQTYQTEAPTSNYTGDYYTHSYGWYSTIADGYESEMSIGLEIAGAIVEVVIGVIGGVVCGYFITFIPPASMHYKDFCRGAYLLCIGVFAVFATDFWGIPGAGALWALGMSFVASLRWGREACEPLEKGWHYMWVAFQPLLFGLTGATVDVATLDSETVLQGLAVLLCGLIIRMLVSSGVVFGLNLKKKEKAFVAISWTPKGTVQAALGSAALDTALALNRTEEEIRWGEQILILAVLVTLITAPAGAFGIGYSGPRLLQSSSNVVLGEDNEGYESSIGEESLNEVKVDLSKEDEVFRDNNDNMEDSDFVNTKM